MSDASVWNNLDSSGFGLPLAAMEAALCAEMLPGEQLLWLGQPDTKEEFQRNLGAFVFGLLWNLIPALFMYLSANAFLSYIRQSNWGGAVFSAVPFLIATVFMVFGIVLMRAPWTQKRVAARTLYAVTNRRAVKFLLKTEAGQSKFDCAGSWWKSDIASLESVPVGNARDVFFATGIDSHGESRRTGFHTVSDSRQLENVIRKTFLTPETEAPALRSADSHEVSAAAAL